jgi:hypothetical protein
VFTLDNTEYAWLRHRRFEDVSPVFTAVLGAAMREIRAKGGITPAQLRRLMGFRISDKAWASYEAGTGHITVERLLDACVQLDVSMSGLVDMVLGRTLDIAGARPSPPEMDEAAAIAAMDQAMAAEERAKRLRAGGRAITENALLRDELAKLRVALANETKFADEETKRADAAEEREQKLGWKLAEANTAHRTAIEELEAKHEQARRDLRGEHRRKLAEINAAHTEHVAKLMHDHATPMEQLASGLSTGAIALVTSTSPAGLAPEPVPEREPARPPSTESLKRERARVAAMTVAADADEYHVRVYNTLHPNQRFTLKALTRGYAAIHVANAMPLPIAQVDRFVSQMCRRFKVDDHHGLVALGRKLFEIEGDNEN